MIEGLTRARQKTADIIEEFRASGEDPSGLEEEIVSPIEAYLQGQRTITVPRISERRYQQLLRSARVFAPMEDPEVVQAFLREIEGYRQGEIELMSSWTTIRPEKERHLLESVTPQEESLVKEALPLIEPRLRLLNEQAHAMQRQMLLELAPKRSSRGKK